MVRGGKMKIVEEEGRRTSQGAYTDAFVYDAEGNKLEPQRESSGSGKHWIDKFSLEEGGVYLITVVDFSNSGKDNSYTRTEGSGELSVAQQQKKEEFEDEHK